MLKGRGFFIWNIRNCENGSVQQIASLAKEAGLTHVLIKVADRYYPYNVSTDGNTDYVPPLVHALRNAGIQVWGWQYIYGYEPQLEARMAVKRIHELALDGFVVDAEKEFKQSSHEQSARIYMQELRSRQPDLPLALSSYRFPSLHMQFPWKAFLDYVNFSMPQVYWEKAHNPGEQLTRTLREYQRLSPNRPVFPTGAAYKNNGWRPSPEDIVEFLTTVEKTNLTGCNFWNWEQCRRDLPEVWQTATGVGRSQPIPPRVDLVQSYIDALNKRNLAAILDLYHPMAVHITSDGITQGTTGLEKWLKEFLNVTLPDARFILDGTTGVRQSRHFNWRAISRHGKVNDGRDTLGILNGKIAYHFTSFNISN